MHFPPRYGRALIRAFWIIGLCVVIGIPPLTAAHPKPPFTVIRAVVQSLSVAEYSLVGLTSALLLGIITVSRSIQHKRHIRWAAVKAPIIEIGRAQALERMKQLMKLAQQISLASIYDAVKLPGGNGLASPLFELPSEFFGLFSWQYVEEGAEALIVDGKVIRRSDPMFSLAGLLRRRMVGRRVLLRPAPLLDLCARALTKDQLELSLTVSLSYAVRDPLAVASLEKPIETIRQRVIGAVAEYIRSQTLLDLLHDDGTLRSRLADQLNVAPSIREGFSIVEVLKALPSGDERLIEIGRKQREAELMQPLIALQGKNQVAAYAAEHQIEILKSELENQRRTAEMQREMQQRQAELNAQNLQSIAASLSLAASTGADPAKLADVLLKLAQGTVSGDALTPSATSELPASTTPDLNAPVDA